MPLPKPPAGTWQPSSLANSILFFSGCLSVMISCSVQEAPSGHEWVLCLDDDVLVHENFLEDLVHDMQHNPAAYMATGATPSFAQPAHCISQGAAPRSGMVSNCGKSPTFDMQAILLGYQKGTPASLQTALGCITHDRHINRRPDKASSQSAVPAGYPFDIPEGDASIFTYSCLAYHLPLSVAFAIRQRTVFVWGGCMLLPLHDLRNDRHGILAAWNQVIYSVM